MFKFKKNIICLLFFFSALIVFFLFKDGFNAYFFQDDWYLLNSTQITQLSQIFTFFIPNSGLIFYRPLGMQLPFLIIKSIFGINPLYFHIVIYLIHLLNGYLFYLLLTKFIKNKYLCWVGSFFYLTSATQMVIMVWSAAIAFVLAPLFYFSSFLFYIRDHIKLSYIIFILGLFVNELLVTLPIIFILYDLLIRRKIYWKRYLIILLITPLYVYFKLSIVNLDQNSSYVFIGQISQLIRNLRIYFLWAFNWPDEIYGQFMSFFKLNPLFQNEFKSYTDSFSLNLLSMVSIFIVIPFGFLTYKQQFSQIVIKKYLFGILWFLITLSPVLFFAKHSYTYHMPISLFGLMLFLLSVFEIFTIKFKLPKISLFLVILAISIWYYSAFENIHFNQLINWVWHRGELSKNITQKMLTKNSVLPDRSIIFISESINIKENRWALGEQNAFQYLYHNPSITTFYGTIDDLSKKIGIVEIYHLVKQKKLYSPDYDNVGVDYLIQYQKLHPQIVF